jgi:hypothetical protein
VFLVSFLASTIGEAFRLAITDVLGFTEHISHQTGTLCKPSCCRQYPFGDTQLDYSLDRPADQTDT